MLDRIRLSGSFRVSNAKFTDETVNEKVVALSRRALGRPGDKNIQDVPVDLAGTFSLANARLNFSRLQFEAPGAVAEVKGSYDLGSEAVNFTGEVRLQAKVSQTMTGAKRVLLKPVDPIFSRHNAGTYLPVNVSGNRDSPQIKLDVKKIF